MPNKSDSAGKLHQYYTAIYFRVINPKINIISPLNSSIELKVHLSSLSSIEVKSIKIIGQLSAEKISHFIKEEITKVEDIGVSSGAVGNNVTDDLIFTTKSKNKIGFSLKCSKDISQILSKNMGAKSLLSDYFNSSTEQNNFNSSLESLHLTFLKKTLNSNLNERKNINKAIEKDAISNKLTKARFADSIYCHMNKERDVFLNKIRNNLFNSISNLNNDQIANGCNLILDTGKNHILAEYKAGKEKVEYINIKTKNKNDIIGFSLRGNDSVVVSTNDYIIGFRYKFESGITSSIKLVGDYKKNT